MPTRSERIAQHIAKAIVRNTNRKFSALHSDVLDIIRKEDQMESNNLAVPTPTVTVTTKKVDELDLQTGEDSRAKAASAVLPPQVGPRDERAGKQ